MPSRITSARRQVAGLRAALLAPGAEELERCVPGLEQTIDSLRSITSVSQAHVTELRALKEELRSVAKLVESGAVFHRGWARLLGAATSGYTSQGEAAGLDVSFRMSVKG
jgi:hypothetical protein